MDTDMEQLLLEVLHIKSYILQIRQLNMQDDLT